MLQFAEKVDQRYLLVQFCLCLDFLDWVRDWVLLRLLPSEKRSFISVHLPVGIFDVRYDAGRDTFPTEVVFYIHLSHDQLWEPSCWTVLRPELRVNLEVCVLYIELKVSIVIRRCQKLLLFDSRNICFLLDDLSLELLSHAWLPWVCLRVIPLLELGFNHSILRYCALLLLELILLGLWLLLNLFVSRGHISLLTLKLWLLFFLKLL